MRIHSFRLSISFLLSCALSFFLFFLSLSLCVLSFCVLWYSKLHMDRIYSLLSSCIHLFIPSSFFLSSSSFLCLFPLFCFSSVFSLRFFLPVERKEYSINHVFQFYSSAFSFTCSFSSM